MPPAKPTLDLLRSLSDEHVLRSLMEHGPMTRAELAAAAGISKPTVSGSVERLVVAGLLRDTGERTTGPGRVGTYYGLATEVGAALVVSIAPQGIVAERLDAAGAVMATAQRHVDRPAKPQQVRRALREAAAEATGGGPNRLAVVSAADPVDRATGRLVHLPDAPFLIGSLDPVAVLAPLVEGPVVVDNDVNWAARAEHDRAGAGALDDFAYLHLGDGLGAAVVSAGEVLRGAGGLAGEVAHVLTRGRGGRAVPFTEVFAELGLRRPGSAAVDSEALLALLEGQGARSRSVRAALATALVGVVAALTAVADPAVVLLGGEWGAHPAVLAAVRAELARQPRRPEVRAASVVDAASLAGARHEAVRQLRERVVALSRAGRGAP